MQGMEHRAQVIVGQPVYLTEYSKLVETLHDGMNDHKLSQTLK